MQFARQSCRLLELSSQPPVNTRRQGNVMVKPILIVPTVETRVLSTTRPLHCTFCIVHTLQQEDILGYRLHGFLDNRALYNESQKMKFHSLIHIKFTFDKIVG
jgi:hypothetical protein